MATIDYEKKYKEALEKARQLCAYPTTNPFISDLQDLFPELAESEDDRIRKALKEYFINSFQNNGVAAILGVHIKDILAWLEKQAEQKPVGFNIGDEITVNGQVCRAVAVDKPVWSEEDEKMLVGCVQAMCTPDAYSLNDRINFEYWLKSLKDRVQQQPKQEWSDKDKEQLGRALYMMEQLDMTESWNDVYNWLKFLIPQNRWKPSEEMLEALYRTIPQDVMEKSEDEILLDKLYQGLKYGKVLSK